MDHRTISTSVRRDNLSAFAVALAVMALVTAMVAVGFGARAIDESGTALAAGGQPPPLRRRRASTWPSSISPASGRRRRLAPRRQRGATPHNMEIEGTDIATEDLASGASAHLALAGVAAGTYTMFCTIPGHRESGHAGDPHRRRYVAAAAEEDRRTDPPRGSTTAWTTRP